MDLHALSSLIGAPVALTALAEGATESEIELIPTGTFEAVGHGTFRVTDPEQMIARSMAYAQSRSGGQLLIDFDHGTEREGTNRNTAAAGWIKSLRHDKDRGRIMAMVAWTPEGRKALSEQRYRFISPVMAHSDDNDVLGVIRAGLTNNPAIGELKALAAHEGDHAMNKLIDKLREALGLDKEADAAAVETAALAALGDHAEVAKIAAAAGVEEGKPLDADAAEKVVATITAAQAKAKDTGADPDPTKYVPKAMFDELSAKVTALEAGGKTARATALIDEAKKAGKLTPAGEKWAADYAAKDPDGFADWMKTAPVVCEAGEIIPALKPAVEGELSAAEKAVCQAMGVSEEAFIATRDGKSLPKPAQKEA